MNTKLWSLAAAAAVLAACESGELAVSSLLLPDSGPVLFDDVAGGNAQGPDGGRTLPVQCREAADCRVGTQPCTTVDCLQGQCVVRQAPANQACDDGDPCTVQTTCRSGACLGTQVCADPPEFWYYHFVPPYPLALPAHQAPAQ